MASAFCSFKITLRSPSVTAFFPILCNAHHVGMPLLEQLEGGEYALSVLSEKNTASASDLTVQSCAAKVACFPFCRCQYVSLECRDIASVGYCKYGSPCTQGGPVIVLPLIMVTKHSAPHKAILSPSRGNIIVPRS